MSSHDIRYNSNMVLVMLIKYEKQNTEIPIFHHYWTFSEIKRITPAMIVEPIFEHRCMHKLWVFTFFLFKQFFPIGCLKRLR